MRELENVMERALLLCNGEEIQPNHLLMSSQLGKTSINADLASTRLSALLFFSFPGTESFNLNKGDNILITGKTTGVIETIVGEMRLNDKLVQDVKKGDNFSMKLDYTVRPKDKLYKVINTE